MAVQIKIWGFISYFYCHIGFPSMIMFNIFDWYILPDWWTFLMRLVSFLIRVIGIPHPLRGFGMTELIYSKKLMVFIRLTAVGAATRAAPTKEKGRWPITASLLIYK
jgi:hypothetical protein